MRRAGFLGALLVALGARRAQGAVEARPRRPNAPGALLVGPSVPAGVPCPPWFARRSGNAAARRAARRRRRRR